MSCKGTTLIGVEGPYMLTQTSLKHFPQSKDTACINRVQEMKELETPAEEGASTALFIWVLSPSTAK